MKFNPSKYPTACTCDRLQKSCERRLHTAWPGLGVCHYSVICIKYIGVDISSFLSWNSHLDHIVGSADKTVAFVWCKMKTTM